MGVGAQGAYDSGHTHPSNEHGLLDTQGYTSNEHAAMLTGIADGTLGGGGLNNDANLTRLSSGDATATALALAGLAGYDVNGEDMHNTPTLAPAPSPPVAPIADGSAANVTLENLDLSQLGGLSALGFLGPLGLNLSSLSNFNLSNFNLSNLNLMANLGLSHLGMNNVGLLHSLHNLQNNEADQLSGPAYCQYGQPGIPGNFMSGSSAPTTSPPDLPTDIAFSVAHLTAM